MTTWLYSSKHSTWQWAFGLFALILSSIPLSEVVRTPLILVLALVGLLAVLGQVQGAVLRLWKVVRRLAGPDQDLVATVESRLRRDAYPALFWWRLLHVVVALVAIFFFVSAAINSMENAQAQTLVQSGAFATLFTCLMASNTALSFWLRFDMTAGRLISLTYVLVAVFAGLVLSHPVSLRSGVAISLVDALFMSCSALTVTGLATVDLAATFSTFGKLVLLALIQTGGIGIVVITAGLAVLVRRRLSIKQVQVGAETYALPEVGSLPAFFAKVVLLTLSFQFLGALVMYASLPADLEMRWLHALFHAVSAFCNAGLSTFSASVAGSDSLIFKVMVCILIVAGGIGFPVAIEVFSRLGNRGQRISRLSDNALLPLIITVLLLVGGALAIFGANVTARHAPIGTEISDALFYSVSARTAGFTLNPLPGMSTGAQLVIVLLMAVGGGPVSTAGGMKTTTLGVLLCTMVSSLRGHKWVQFRRREIPAYIVQKAVTVCGLFVGTIFLAFMLLLVLERSAPWPLFFECVSALATVGLSLDLTPQLSAPGKIVVMMLMLVGRIGLATVVYAGVGKIGEQKYRMAPGRFDVG